MKRPLKTLFYGRTHEHAAGKLNTLRSLTDDFEIVAIVDAPLRRELDAKMDSYFNERKGR